MYTMEGYINALKSHDWTYMYSDDHRVFLAGKQNRDTLVYMRASLDPDARVWNQYVPEGYRINSLLD
jgi:hypothetical protein